MKKRIFAALLALCLTALTGCDWSTADPEDIFGTLTDYYNVEQKKQDVKLTSFALPYLKGETADPITCSDGAMQTLGALLYEGLFALDGSFDPQPALAESYTYDAARYTYTITLRSGVTFSDGSAVTARDVVNSLRRALSSARYSGRLAEVSDLWASGGAVRITLTGDNRSFVSRLDIPIVKSGTESSTFPTGTGPYAYSGEGGAHLAKNASWWQGKSLPLERIELTACKDTDSVSYAFYAREVQLLFCDLTGADDSSVYGSGDYTDAATTIMQYLCLNTRRAPFDDPAVRRAVTLGVDRASCVSAYLLGHGLAAQFPVSPASGLYPKDLEAAYSQDGYASALEAAGLNTGKTRSLTLLVNQESSFRVSTAQTIAAGLSRYDLLVTVRSLPYDEYIQALEQGDFDLCLCQVKLTADWDLRLLLQSYAAMNYGGYTDPETDALLAALKPGCRLVMVGDPDQLPSVGPGNVLGDILRSGAVDSVTLTEVFRQAEQSAIIRNAHRVNLGESPDLKGNQGDFFFLCRRDAQRAVATVLELCKTRLPDNMHIPAEQIQVLTPTRKGPCGTINLNRLLQEALNPRTPGKREILWGERVFRVGDRIMQTRNDYDVVWQKDDGTVGTGMFNGDVGRIAEIDAGGEWLALDFDGRKAPYSVEMLSEIDLAYAQTVHKAQGSEYRCVVLAAMPSAPSLMVRGVLYTALTRARELLVIVGDDAAIRSMAANDKQQKRYSGLKWRLCHAGDANGE